MKQLWVNGKYQGSATDNTLLGPYVSLARIQEINHQFPQVGNWIYRLREGCWVRWIFTGIYK